MASLNSFKGTLDLRKAKHLLRRATFNYTKSQLDALVGITPANALDMLTVAFVNTLPEPYDPFPADNPDGYWTSSIKLPQSFGGHNRKRAFVTGWWWYNAMNEISLKHKLSFFLHTTFTVGKDLGTGPATIFFDHINLLDFYALGNIKTLAKKITLDNAMLTYLNNTQNNKNNPNENYAREYLELFTILKGEQIGDGNYTNYTELDIQQAAKIFSGFKTKNDRSEIDNDTGIPRGYSNFFQHNNEDKTFSSAFGNHVIIGAISKDDMTRELNDFVDMVFAQQETAKAYARKLYRYFVKSDWNDTVEVDIITPLSEILIDNDFEILPAVTTLLASEHFYDADDTNPTDNIIGAIIKSPLQQLSEVCSMFNVSFPKPTNSSNLLRYYNNFFLKFIHNTYFKAAGMALFNPDSVAGYPAYHQEPGFDRNWFSSNTLIGRYKLIESLIIGRNTINPNARIYTDFDSVGFIKNKLSNPENPVRLITEITGFLYPEAINTDRVNYFKTFLVDEGFPDYYWTDLWSQYVNDGDAVFVKVRLDALIIAMVNASEFQLM